jgi:RyR domain
LHSIGCVIAPLTAGGAADFRFTEAEVEKLGSAEHDRWMRERRNAGWTLGDKDAECKKTPYLVPFADLPDDIAEYDRMFVREIPTLLASVGLQVVRMRPD